MKSKPIKICYLFPVMDLGGSEKHALQLAEGLQKKGHDVRIVSVFREGTLAEEIRQKNIPLTSLEIGAGWGLKNAVRIFEWLKSNQVDILHTCLFGFHIFAGLPASLLNVPVILSSRRELGDWQANKHLFLEKLGNRFTHKIVCCSEAVRQRTLEKEKMKPEKTVTLYNGVDWNLFGSVQIGDAVREEFGIPKNAPVIGTVANLAVEKGYPYLLEAARQVLASIPEARFLFVGFGPLEKELKEKARQISPQIIFAGKRQDIPELIAAMDLFVLASVTEGFPNALLEAMAAGKPVVATDVGGVPELIQQGEDGTLVPPQNAKALADEVLSLLKNPEKAGRLVTQAREKIKKDFTLDRMIDRYEMFYQALLEQKNKMLLRLCHSGSPQGYPESRSRLGLRPSGMTK